MKEARDNDFQNCQLLTEEIIIVLFNKHARSQDVIRYVKHKYTHETL